MLQINENIFVQPFRHGLKLSTSPKTHSAARAIDFLNIPFNSYFLDPESKLIAANEIVAENHRVRSLNDIIGKEISYYIPNKDEAMQIICKDRSVMKNNTLKFIDDSYFASDDFLTSYFTLKMPVYNEDNRTIGIFGCSVLINEGAHQITAFLNALTETGILTLRQQSHLTLSSSVKNGISLTNRETEIIRHTIRGRTAKKIAQELGISYRTCENYLQNIRMKLGVNNKAELIELFLES